MKRRHVTDLTLARRLERTEASSNAAFVDARKAVDPSSDAEWRDFGGTYAMFDGVDSPLTQTFSLGLFSSPNDDQLAAIEAFFRDHGSDVHHEVCPIADAALLSLLPRRGYHPIELSTVLHQSLPVGEGGEPTSEKASRTSGIRTRAIAKDETEQWARYSAMGWGHAPELAAFMESFGRITAAAKGITCFVAELAGETIATGALAIHDGVALLAGASTRPEFRGRGAQTALLAARLTHATNAGCDIAMMAAAPGSTSQTNAERQGFAVAYTRTKWKLAIADNR